MAFRAREEKFRDDSVSDMLGTFGQMLTIISVIEFPPAYRIMIRVKYLKMSRNPKSLKEQKELTVTSNA